MPSQDSGNHLYQLHAHTYQHPPEIYQCKCKNKEDSEGEGGSEHDHTPSPLVVKPKWLYFTLPGIIHMESMEWGMDSRLF